MILVHIHASVSDTTPSTNTSILVIEGLDTRGEYNNFWQKTIAILSIPALLEGADPRELAGNLVAAGYEKQLRRSDYRWRPPRVSNRILSGQKPRHHRHRRDR